MIRLRRRGGAVLGAIAVALLGACGGSPPAGPTKPAAAGPEPEFWSAEVPKAPAAQALWRTRLRELTDVVAAPGVFAFRHEAADTGKPTVSALDARTGRQRWAAAAGSSPLLASDSPGPAGATKGARGTVYVLEDVAVPQAGLEPASTRTEVVARNGADGAERWRVPILSRPVGAQARSRVVALQAQPGVVAVATTSTLHVLEAETGRERWRQETPLSPAGAETSSRPEGWRSLVVGPDLVAASALLPGDKARVQVWDRETGKRRWMVDVPSPKRLSFSVLGVDQLHLARGRLITRQAFLDANERTQGTLVAYRDTDGKRIWPAPGEFAPPGTQRALDSADGTLVRASDTSLDALNVLNGKVRWTSDSGVKIGQLAAEGGRTYLTAESGSHRQLVVLGTRTREQLGVQGVGRSLDLLRLFEGAIVTSTSSGDVSVLR